MRFLIAIFIINACLLTGCQTVDSDREAVAYRAGRIGTAAYLYRRSDLDIQRREAVRQVYLASSVVLSLALEMHQDIDYESAMAEAIAQRIEDPAIQPLATEFMHEVVAMVRARIPEDSGAGDAWQIALAVHRGISDVLAEHGIDPTKPVEALR